MDLIESGLFINVMTISFYMLLANLDFKFTFFILDFFIIIFIIILIGISSGRFNINVEYKDFSLCNINSI